MYFFTKQNSNNTCFTSSCENVFIHRIAASFIISHTQAGLGACKIVPLAGTVAFAFGSCATACCQLINTWRSRGVLSSELELACYCPTSIHFLLARGHSEVTLELCSKQKLESLLSRYDDKDILMWEEGPRSSLFWQKRRYRASSAFAKLFPDA